MRQIGRRAVIIAPFVLLLAGCAARPKGESTDAAHGPSSAPARPTPSSSPTPTVPSFDKTANSTTDPSSIWVVLNKKHPLNPVDYVPPDLTFPPVTYVNHTPLRQAAADALVAMFAAGKAEAGLSFSIQSGYRSYASQQSVYAESVRENGQAVADDLTAHPGTSEHQAGLAVDISAVPAAHSLQEAFGTTPHGQWLAANAYRFGFLLRYPADKVEVTGYSYEPWHFRYIGTDLAAELRAEGVETLEEFFGIPGGTSY